MSSKAIKELRQAGKLDEALQMANQALELDSENIWNKRAAAWVYYDYLKKYAQLEQYEEFKGYLIKISDLQLPEDEKMVFDNCAWQIGSIVFSLQKTEQVDFVKINELFDLTSTFHFTKPSEAYSFIYKAFHKGYQNWSGYLTFADWWNLDNFRSEDFLKEEYNGKKIMSIAEQAYIAYSKKLLEGTPIDAFGQQKVIDKDKIQSFLPKLDYLIETHPDYQYPPYFKAKLLLALGNDENVLSAFLPFAKKKRNDFWVWELMAEIFLENKEIQFACYCKALSLKTPEDFLIKLRQSFAEMLIHKSMFSEAKTEIQKIISTRDKHQWKIPNQIMQWTEMEWYKSANSKRDNSELYLMHLKQAEELLFQDIPEELIVVEFVNHDKQVLNFVINENKHGFFSYRGFLKKPTIGQLYDVRFAGASKDGFYKLLSIEESKQETSQAIKNFEGKLKLNLEGKFGFVDDIFVDPNLITKMSLENDQLIKGKAILSFNKKKNQWGWKILTLTANGI
ncbi:MAG: hypothetical protein FJZ66_05825 [Bacteroidetes bacterium]|nr:hypothetical protein [Bacteroidota bacterium]MBM3454898.1 hypothetical protein [Bacteroidota bacterium]